MIPLLVLRPEPGASATAKRAMALGLSPMVLPLFSVGPVAWDTPDSALFDALLLTSANAVRHGGKSLASYHKLPVFAVGTATAQAASDAGFTHVIGGTGNAADALHALAKASHRRPLHLSGADRTPYPHLLFAITTRTVYASTACAVTVSHGRAVAIVHSARAAARFAALCPSPTLVDVVAISQAVADGLAHEWRSVHAAPEPTDNAMLALAALLCDGSAVPNGPI
jgi:uroporphyrinogen-III synthase